MESLTIGSRSHPDPLLCNNSSSKYTLLHIDADEDWATIPQHLVLGFLVTLVSLPLYCLFRWIAGRRSPTPKNTTASPPSLFSLVMGRADEWLKMEKGRAAFNYINFQRMLLFMSLVTLVISGVSLLINFLVGNQSKKTSFFKTIITNLSDNSPYHYFNIISSFLLPWLVVIVVRQFMVIRDKIHSSSYEDSSTLVIDGLDPIIFSDTAIAEYFSTNYPNFQLLKITRAQDTRYLRRKMLLLEWNTSVIKEFLDMKDRSECSCCGNERSLAAFGRRELEIKKIIQQELRRLRSKTDFLRIVFLTFQSNVEAEKIVLMEKLDHFSNYSTIKQAPRPKDIAWENMRSPVLSIIINTFCFFIILVVSLIASSPTAFSKKITDTIKKWLHNKDPDFILSWMFKSVIPVTMFLLFSQSMPYLVKVSSVKFGPWSRTKLVSNYMVTLFFWLLLTTVIFPTLMLSNIYQSLELIVNLPILSDILDMVGSSDNETIKKLDCIIIPSSGAFFVNYLVLSALIRSQTQLHMVGDLLYQLWMVLIYCCTRAERRVASAYARDYCLKRNTGENTSLSEDYVWCVVHFAILMCFCLICPLVSPMFLLYMINKHMVDLQNLRVSYSATVEQPILIRTAAKLVIFCPLLGQVCTTIVHLTNKNQEENSSLFLVSGCLLILNMSMLLILQSTGWVFPVSVLGDKKNEKRRHLRRGDVYEDPAMCGVLTGY